jgi:endonuclease YncB( thermonuclease family)
MVYASAMRCALFLGFALLAFQARAGIIEGRVIEVSDGQTITVLAREGSSMHRVRLAGVEAPSARTTPGSSARETLRKLVRGKQVRVDTRQMDAKGVLVGVVQVYRSPEEVIDPGLSLINAGWASVDKTNLSFHPEEAQREYAQAETRAKGRKIGMWRVPTPVRTLAEAR